MINIFIKELKSKLKVVFYIINCNYYLCQNEKHISEFSNKMGGGWITAIISGWAGGLVASAGLFLPPEKKNEKSISSHVQRFSRQERKKNSGRRKAGVQ